MSDTPRTDQCIDEMSSSDIGWDRLADHARQLERELTKALDRAAQADASMSFLDDAFNSGDGTYRP